MPAASKDSTPEIEMTELSDTLYGQMKESAELDAVIRQNLKGPGYGE